MKVNFSTPEINFVESTFCKRRIPLIFGILVKLLLLVCLTLGWHPGFSRQPPNIILILADDLGYGDLGCYGQQKIKTPHIDKLAAEGILFTDFYSGATVCAPSRASLLTGLHNGHSPVRGNQPFPQQLGDQPTIASVLKKAGYTSAVLGKWGVGHPQPIGDPQRVGFDYSFGYLNMWHAHNFFPEFLYENDQRVTLPGNKLKPESEWSNNSWVGGDPKYKPEGYGESDPKITYVPDVMEQKAKEFILQNKNKPFFIYYTTTIPHSNNEIKANGMEVPNHGIYETESWPDVEKGFAAAISRLDATVGNLVAFLKEHNLDKNTLVIFTSDNGPHSEGGHNPDFFDSNGKYRGKKRDLYEGGLRMPMIAWMPGKIKAGSRSDLPSAQWDFLPTFCELAGTAAPAKIDGISLLPAFFGKEKSQQKHDYLYWEFYEEGGKQSVLQYPWKLLKLNTTTFDKNGKFELYNIEADPAEEKNIIDQYPGKAAELKKLMKQAHVEHPNMSIDKARADMGGKI